jgi:peptidoglycan lytic transglycosylase D
MRATGMWQFMNWRGNQYGLIQTPYQDDRLDPEKATRAAARHLRDLYTEFGDWYLAIAAYNCGPGGVERAVERTGYADFWELRARGAIPAETTNYVPIILAMTIMAKNAAEYGLVGLTPETPVEYDTMDVTATTHLNLVADLTDSPVSELMALNPALLKGIAPAGYSLRVPKGSAGALRASLEMIPPDKRLSWRMHKVADGETLASISKRYGASVNMIAAANKLLSSDPVAGDRLAIPTTYTERVPARTVTQHSAVHRTVSGNTTHRGIPVPAHRTAVKATTPASHTPIKRKPPKVLTHTALNSQP